METTSVKTIALSVLAFGGAAALTEYLLCDESNRGKPQLLSHYLRRATGYSAGAVAFGTGFASFMAMAFYICPDRAARI